MPWAGRADSSTVTGDLLSAVEEAPDRPFLDFEGRVNTFEDIWTQVTALARGLRLAGVGEGDTVAAMLGNHEDSVASWYATNLLGAIWVGVNTALKGEFLRNILHDCGTRLVICEPDLLDRVIQIEKGIPSVESVFVRTPTVSEQNTRLHVASIEELRSEGRDEGWHTSDPDDISLLVYTGGTTGPSKGCANSHGYVLNLARRYIEQTGREPSELNWTPLPIFHFNAVGQTITSTVRLRATAALARRFSASRFWPEIERTQARIVNLLGAMGTILAQMPPTPEMERCFGQIRFVHGAPFPADLQRIWQERFGVENVGGPVYGLTEAVPLTTLNYGTPAPPGSCGKRNEEDFEVKIFDERDNEMPDGQIGEVVARPNRPNVMFQGYWRRPDAIAEATGHLWFHTGDLGFFDPEGYFYFVDRKKDYLRRRGENISSSELESVYLNHPDIALVAVHAVPSELTEDDVKVTAVLQPGSSLTPETLYEWSINEVPDFALPRYIEFRDELPTSPVGRILKVQLREEGCTPGTWDRERQ